MLQGSFRETPNQVDLMKVVLDFADRGVAPSSREISAALGWASSRQYLQEAIDGLEGHGFLVRGYGREFGGYLSGKPMFVKPTLRAHHKWRGVPAAWRLEDLKPSARKSR